MIVGPTHYDVLGVEVYASGEEVRRAYLRRARELHPDRAPGSGRAMQDVNEAWRVLGDPARRTAYDQRLAAAAAPPPEPADGGVDPADVPYPRAPAVPGDAHVAVVRGLPWIAITLVLVAIFVFTAFAGGRSDDGPSPSRFVGECVRVEAGSGLSTVPCDEPNDGRVDLVVTRASLCPSGSVATPVPGDRAWLCVRRVSPG